jgi:hypothetical protein
MLIGPSKISCGIREMYGLSLADFKNMLNGLNAGQQSEGLMQSFTKNWTYIFSDSTGHGNGNMIARFIKDNDLGDLTEMGEWQNPNTLHTINLWIWKYNGNKLKPVEPPKPKAPAVGPGRKSASYFGF